jgi:hypothetical protein
MVPLPTLLPDLSICPILSGSAFIASHYILPGTAVRTHSVPKIRGYRLHYY